MGIPNPTAQFFNNANFFKKACNYRVFGKRSKEFGITRIEAFRPDNAGFRRHFERPIEESDRAVLILQNKCYDYFCYRTF